MAQGLSLTIAVTCWGTCELSRCVLAPQDEDEEVYKRDFSAPTLEDHFNKTILPKVMQVGELAGVTVPQGAGGSSGSPRPP